MTRSIEPRPNVTVIVRLLPEPGRSGIASPMWLRTDIQGNDSPGPAPVVAHIGWDGTLDGRWHVTGIEVMSSRSPVGEFVEGEHGYFCAWRVQ